MPKEEDDTDNLICHTIGEKGIRSYAEGALALILVWGGVHVGILSPFIAAILYRFAGIQAAATFFGLAVGSLIAPLRHSASFCRFYLQSASCAGGATIWFSKKIFPIMEGDNFMVCMHPHGIVPLGFSFNGALRVKALRPDKYLPSGVTIKDNCNGIQAPVLWRVPFMASVLRLWDSCTPATKTGLKKLMAARVAFGILPGGSEEVAIHQHGQENVYIKSRCGFIKYGLEYGYAIVVCYTFGETDQYNSVGFLRPLNLWLVKKLGFVLPIFWGKAYCPLLPRGGGLNTVYGDVIQLPKLEKPTDEDVAKWHQVYVDRLTATFDQHKSRFGYGDRKLNCF